VVHREIFAPILHVIKIEVRAGAREGDRMRLPWADGALAEL
jgi:hypothetical protein